MGRGDDNQLFAKDGPKHMMGIEQIDWDNDEHCRCITASLVKGTYVMERDRSHGKENTPSALAPAWSENFHYFRQQQRDYRLEFECDCVFCRKISKLFHGAIPTCVWFIYGAVFKYAPPPGAGHPSAPRYIVAFRGTMAGDPTGAADLRNNFSILLNKQHLCGRFRHAREVVEKLLGKERERAGGVWLAGHSLGASIALDVGRHMMINEGSNLRTFLFNPPHVSLAAAVGEEARRDVFTITNTGRRILGKFVPEHKDHMEALFERLVPWVPYLYVNPNDFICEGFIVYFEQRELMKQRDPRLASATSLSYRDMLCSLFGRQTERPHLIPSAKLWKNQSQQHSCHGICQWWQPSEKLVLSSPKIYTWP